MKHTNKKGFTIVELVIVIAVIAILAAVLIPTFTNLIKKANISNDTAIAKNLNTAISVAGVLDGVEDFEDAIAAVREQGFLLANLNAKTDGCYFVWEAQSKQFLLVDTKADFKVLYSANKDYAPIGETWNIITSDMKAADELEQLGKGITVKRTIRATADMNELINSSEEVLVYVDESVQLGEEGFVKLNKAGAIITLDFGNAAVQGGSANADLAAFPIDVVAGTMNIKNGTISAASAFVDADDEVRYATIFAHEGATVNVEGTVVETNNASSLFTYHAANGTLKNVTIKTPNGDNAVNANGKTADNGYTPSNVTLEDCNIDVKFIAAQATYGGNVVINGGNYHASLSNLLCVNVNGTITVKGGTFSCDAAEKTFKFYNHADNKIVIEGGTFNGVAFENLTAELLESWCNMSSVTSYNVKAEKVNGAWEITLVPKA